MMNEMISRCLLKRQGLFTGRSVDTDVAFVSSRRRPKLARARSIFGAHKYLSKVVRKRGLEMVVRRLDVIDGDDFSRRIGCLRSRLLKHFFTWKTDP